ncbi:MAG: hypothetical protein FJX68_12660 [Alphaproteobacteria bacterium]|nr:hypothetical protein [Alphaproteobacteria bacterium]
MRAALRQREKLRSQISTLRSVPAPIGGWNTRDALASMKPTEAIALDNWFPGTSYCEIRGGHANHATDMTGNGKTLAVHTAATGTAKMFCATSIGVYDVSSAGAVGASVAARTNGKHQHTNFGDGTNHWLIMVNGVDKPLYYNGSAWTAVDDASSPALTGLTTTSLVGVFVFKGRLIFLQNDLLGFWYLAAGTAGGALTKFDLSGQASRGGYVIAGANWTVDGGDGIDDRAVFVTSKGEIIVYQGTDPASASTWAKVGTYSLAEPLGRRCLVKYGGDLVILTENGAFPLSVALNTADQSAKLALSFKIENTFTEAARTYGSVFGWDAIVYPERSALIVNVPLAEDGTHYQYVMNTITKAWCRFTDWPAEDFAVFDTALYFTTGTKVVKAWSGVSDNGANIVAYGKTAFHYFGSPSSLKRFSMFRPVLAVDGALAFLTDIDVDFKNTSILGSAVYAKTSSAVWDTDKWDSGSWAAELEIIKEWTSPDEYSGLCSAGKIRVDTNDLTVRWISCDYLFESGAGNLP